ncbi:hypothetical protein PG990_003069 [Apiospora arundinis]
MSSTNATSTQQEKGRPNNKRAHGSSRPKASYEYNWDADLKAYNKKAHSLGLVELTVRQVARVIEGGDLTAIFDTDPIRPAKNFIIYDGLDVLARVNDYEMESLVYDYAANFIGSRLHWSHPTEKDLNVSSIEMKGRIAGGYAVMITAPEAESSKEQKKSRKLAGRA